MPEITLHIQPGFQVPGRPRCFSGSPFAIKVQRILQYKRLTFEVREIGWMERSEALPKISASRKLPVLEYDGERIEDSTQIAYALEARHPEPRLLPRDEVLAARSHFLEEWADEALYWYGIYEARRITEGNIVGTAYFAGLPEEFRVAAIERAAQQVDDNLDRQGIGRYPPEKVKADMRRGLDALVGLLRMDGFVAGSELSLADIAIFAQLHRRSAGTNPWLESELHSRSALYSWIERVDRMTSRAASCALDDEPTANS